MVVLLLLLLLWLLLLFHYCYYYYHYYSKNIFSTFYFYSGNDESADGTAAGTAEVTAAEGTAAAGGAGRGDPLDEEQRHVYIAAMQLFPIKLNFSFIKNADVKVCEVCVHAAWGGGQCLSLLSILYLKIIVITQRLSGRRCYTTPRRPSYLLFKGRSSYAL